MHIDVCVHMHSFRALSCILLRFTPSKIPLPLLLITKILRSVISASLLFCFLSSPSLLVAAAHSRRLLLVYININQCLQRDESPEQKTKHSDGSVHTHTHKQHACMHKWHKNRYTHTPDKLQTSCCFSSESLITMVTPHL